MIKQIITDTNILKKVSRDASVLQDDIPSIIKDLKDTIVDSDKHSPGHIVGLSAIQIGIPVKIAIANIRGKIYHLINSKISYAKRPEVSMEGCASLPKERSKPITRNMDIDIDNWDYDPDTKQLVRDDGRCEGFLARVVQHEMDHWQGMLYPERYEVQHLSRNALCPRCLNELDRKVKIKRCQLHDPIL